MNLKLYVSYMITDISFNCYMLSPYYLNYDSFRTQPQNAVEPFSSYLIRINN